MVAIHTVNVCAHEHLTDDSRHWPCWRCRFFCADKCNIVWAVLSPSPALLELYAFIQPHTLASSSRLYIHIHAHQHDETWCFYGGAMWRYNNETSYTERGRHLNLNATCSTQLIQKKIILRHFKYVQVHTHRHDITQGKNECFRTNARRIIKEIIQTRKSKEENGKSEYIIHNGKLMISCGFLFLTWAAGMAKRHPRIYGLASIKCKGSALDTASAARPCAKARLNYFCLS